MELLEDGLTGAVLGHYLHETRVKIIDAWLAPAQRQPSLITNARSRRFARTMTLSPPPASRTRCWHRTLTPFPDPRAADTNANCTQTSHDHQVPWPGKCKGSGQVLPTQLRPSEDWACSGSTSHATWGNPWCSRVQQRW